MKFIFLTIILATGLFISTQSNEKPDDIPSLTHPFSEEYDTYEKYMDDVIGDLMIKEDPINYYTDIVDEDTPSELDGNTLIFYSE